ncbi:MAG: hypothetical protein AAF799_05700 [Myxococcota bacterium]
MSPIRIATAFSLVAMLAFATSCAGILRRSGDEIRRQQVASKPLGTGTDSSKAAPKKGKGGNKGTRSGGGKTPNKGKDDPKALRKIAHGVSYDLADGLVDGAVDSLHDPKRQKQIADLSQNLEERVESISEGAGKAAIKGLNEKLPETRGAIIKMLEGIGKEIGLNPEKNVRKLFGEVGKSLKTEIRPQVRLLIKDTMDEVLGKGLQTRLDENVGPAVKNITKDIPVLVEEVAEGAVRGFASGMAAELDPETGKLGQQLGVHFSNTREVVDDGLSKMLWIALIGSAVFLTIVILLFLRARSQRNRREDMLRMVATAIKEVGKEGDLATYRQEVKRIGQLNRKERQIMAALNHFLTSEGLKL